MIDFIIHSNDTNWGHVWHIVTTDGKGMITIELGEDDKKRFYFYGLSVTPDLRRKGVGTELLKAAEKLSMENGKGEKVKNLQVGTLIKLIKDDIVISNLVIKKINENDDKSEIFMDSSENKKFSNDCIILEQTCYIMCKKLKENATFLMVKHIGHEFISDEKLNALSVIKKKILLNYKNILEKNFNSNLKSNDDSINLNISSSNSI